jgi:hypothetical protein
VLFSVLQDRCRFGRSDSGQGVQLRSGGGVEVDLSGGGSRCPAEGHVRANGLEQNRADSGHPVEALEIPKRAMLLPIGDDGLGQAGPDLRQPGELADGRSVQVDPLAGSKRSRPEDGTVPLG